MRGLGGWVPVPGRWSRPALRSNWTPGCTLVCKGRVRAATALCSVMYAKPVNATYAANEAVHSRVHQHSSIIHRALQRMTKGGTYNA